MSYLKEVIISITNNCNLRCKMCDIPSKKVTELNTDIWKNVILHAKKLSCETIVFSGGEPLLRDDIFELIPFVRNNNMRTCVTSNGYCIDKTTAKRLFSAGVNVVNVSIEGPEKIHDWLRGEGAFSKAVEAIGNLQEANIETTIATMVSRYNYKSLNYIIELARDYGVTTIKFQPFSDIFLMKEKQDYSFIAPSSEKIKIQEAFKDAYQRCNNYGIATNPLGYLEKISEYLSGDSLLIRHGCPALQTVASISAEGDIYPCWVINGKDDLIGNVRKRSLYDIWNSKYRSDKISSIIKKGCPGCMMSCYDNVFPFDKNLSEKILFNFNKSKREGMRNFLNNMLKKWTKRVRFYAAYRGTFPMLFRKIKMFFSRHKTPLSGLNKAEIIRKLEEIESLKKYLDDDEKS